MAGSSREDSPDWMKSFQAPATPPSSDSDPTADPYALDDTALTFAATVPLSQPTGVNASLIQSGAQASEGKELEGEQNQATTTGNLGGALSSGGRLRRQNGAAVGGSNADVSKSGADVSGQGEHVSGRDADVSEARRGGRRQSQGIKGQKESASKENTNGEPQDETQDSVRGGGGKEKGASKGGAEGSSGATAVASSARKRGRQDVVIDLDSDEELPPLATQQSAAGPEKRPQARRVSKTPAKPSSKPSTRKPNGETDTANQGAKEVTPEMEAVSQPEKQGGAANELEVGESELDPYALPLDGGAESARRVTMSPAARVGMKSGRSSSGGLAGETGGKVGNVGGVSERRGTALKESKGHVSRAGNAEKGSAKLWSLFENAGKASKKGVSVPKQDVDMDQAEREEEQGMAMEASDGKVTSASKKREAGLSGRGKEKRGASKDEDIDTIGGERKRRKSAGRGEVLVEKQGVEEETKSLGDGALGGRTERGARKRARMSYKEASGSESEGGHSEEENGALPDAERVRRGKAKVGEEADGAERDEGTKATVRDSSPSRDPILDEAAGEGDENPVSGARKRKKSEGLFLDEKTGGLVQKRVVSPAKRRKSGVTETEGMEIDELATQTTAVPTQDVGPERKGKLRAPATLPLVLPDKVHTTKVLVECEGEGENALDLSGDVGAVGRFSVLKRPGGEGENMFLDLKGVMYQATIVPTTTFMVVNLGPTEAKVEAIMNDFVQLREENNVFQTETTVEGTLDDFDFGEGAEDERPGKSTGREAGAAEGGDAPEGATGGKPKASRKKKDGEVAVKRKASAATKKKPSKAGSKTKTKAMAMPKAKPRKPVEVKVATDKSKKSKKKGSGS